MTSTEEKSTDQPKKEIPEIIQYVNSNDLKEVQKTLLSGKAKIEDNDENGMTPLQHAAYKGQYEMCKLLLEFGADVNADQHDHKYSPLHFAALSGNVEVVQLLLTAGAKTYRTNTLNRTATQMAAFVGNHTVVALINNYLPLSNIEYYTKPQGLESEPKLLLEVASPLYNLIMQTNLHPVYIAMMVEKSSILLKNLEKSSKILSLMCEREAKRSENVNEVICLKFHFLSYVLKTLHKELLKPENSENQEEKSDKLIFETIIKKWLIGRKSDGFQEHLEYYVRDAIKAFPYVEMPLFLQVVRNVTCTPGESWAIDILHGVINGQKGFDDGITCSTCGLENKGVKKCSKCKGAQYCNKLCQRLQWNTHKKFCDKYKQIYNQAQETSKENKDVNQAEA